MHVARAKREKTRASKSRLVLVLLLIGRGSGARFFNHSQSVVCHQDFQTPMKWVENQGAADFFKLTSKFLDTW